MQDSNFSEPAASDCGHYYILLHVTYFLTSGPQLTCTAERSGSDAPLHLKFRRETIETQWFWSVPIFFCKFQTPSTTPKKAIKDWIRTRKRRLSSAEPLLEADHTILNTQSHICFYFFIFTYTRPCLNFLTLNEYNQKKECITTTLGHKQSQHPKVRNGLHYGGGRTLASKGIFRDNRLSNVFLT